MPAQEKREQRVLWEPLAALCLSFSMPASTILQEKRVLELERMKSKAETACKKLERDVLAIKQQKVGPAPLELGHCSSLFGRALLPCVWPVAS